MTNEKSNKSNREKTRELTMMAMFIAIIALLGLVPSGWGASTIGFIKIAPDLEATIIHIPVLIGAALFGRKMGIWLGTAFGIVSMIAAFIYSSPFFIYPWVSVLPRIIFGLIIFDVVKFFQRFIKNRHLAYGVSFLILTLIHTILVLSMFWTSFALVNHFTLKEAFIPYLEALVLWGIPISAPAEAILAGLVGASVTTRLKESLVRNKSLQTEEKE
ncbi:MAG TPA: ECF transporter S component [Bacillota bacterium]|nr:ECF transporter S component [Bacillota bacterium]HPQ61422.1 ECF transporter S component [Bacillota bacterium]